MDIVTRQDLNELVERRAGPCVSIYQPTHRVGPDTRTYAISVNSCYWSRARVAAAGAGDKLSSARQVGRSGSRHSWTAPTARAP